MSTRLLILALGLILSAAMPMAQSAPPSDLDAFMSRVLTKRDENWKKLQQYVLDEQETFLVSGPAGIRLFGGRREYQWFPREGFFVRSPTRADGVAINDETRRKEEERWLKREQLREKRRAESTVKDDPATDTVAPSDVGDILRQSVEPDFVRSAYFLRFKFDQGHYALVGREKLLGRDVLKIEYYPSKLFADDDDDKDGRGREDRRRGREGQEGRRTQTEAERKKDAERGAKIERQMNKVARVTLWVEPAAHQILQYELHNVEMDFLPGRSFIRMDELNASMRMTQPFPDVWLPDTLGIRAGMTLAIGRVAARYDVKYSDYRLASVTTRVR